MNKKVLVAGIVICLLSALTAVIYITKEPVKSLVRQIVINKVISDIEGTDMSDPVFNVPATDLLAVNGEEDLSIDLSGYDETCELHLAGLLEIPSIDVKEPCWIECSRQALRYGVSIWPDSAMPWMNGNCTILGHRNRHISTIFCRLQEIGIGASVFFTLPTGEILRYKVYNTANAAPQEIEALICRRASKERQLTIITCATELGAGYRFLAICRPSD